MNGGLTEGRQGHEKRNCKSYEIYCCGECIDTLCDYDGMWLLAENPSAVTNSTDTGAGDANTTDASNMQSQDQSEDTSGSSDEGGDNEE